MFTFQKTFCLSLGRAGTDFSALLPSNDHAPLQPPSNHPNSTFHQLIGTCSYSTKYPDVCSEYFQKHGGDRGVLPGATGRGLRSALRSCHVRERSNERIR